MGRSREHRWRRPHPSRQHDGHGGGSAARSGRRRRPALPGAARRPAGARRLDIGRRLHDRLVAGAVRRRQRGRAPSRRGRPGGAALSRRRAHTGVGSRGARSRRRADHTDVGGGACARVPRRGGALGPRHRRAHARRSGRLRSAGGSRAAASTTAPGSRRRAMPSRASSTSSTSPGAWGRPRSPSAQPGTTRRCRWGGRSSHDRRRHGATTSSSRSTAISRRGFGDRWRRSPRSPPTSDCRARP